MMFAAIALQSSDSSGPLARRLAAWIARATVSLPVPGSPTIRIGRRLRADLAATASAARNSGAAPTSCSSASSGASFSETGASSPAARRRSALAASASSSRSGATGRTRKSDAPARIASTATETLSPWERTITGRSCALVAQRRDQLGPVLRVPAAEQRGLHFAAVRALEQGERASPRRPRRRRSSRRARRSPRSAGARRHWRRAAIGSVLVLRASAPCRRSLCAEGVKAALSGVRCLSVQGLGESASALLWTPPTEVQRREHSWPKKSRCSSSPPTQDVARARRATTSGSPDC